MSFTSDFLSVFMQVTKRGDAENSDKDATAKAQLEVQKQMLEALKKKEIAVLGD